VAELVAFLVREAQFRLVLRDPIQYLLRSLVLGAEMVLQLAELMQVMVDLVVAKVEIKVPQLVQVAQ